VGDILIMIYLLGGPPRVGKSKISGVVRKRHALSVVSTDTLGAVLQSVLSPDAVPDLYVFGRFDAMPTAERVNLMMEDPAGLIDYVRRESSAVWRAVEAFAGRENDEGRDTLIEGVAVLPELMSQIGHIPHRAVFLGNQGENLKENIRRSAREDRHDWMRDMNDRYVAAFAGFVRRMSACIEEEAGSCGFEYIEMSGKSLGDVAEKVMESLGLSAG
jgi:2-phosphoglycerate kinase